MINYYIDLIVINKYIGLYLLIFMQYIKKLKKNKYIGSNYHKILNMQALLAKKDIEKKYAFEKEIGSGHYGKAVLSIDRETKEKVVIKVINKIDLLQKIKEEYLIREVKIMKMCNHPHIIKYIDFYIDDTNYYIVMEYIEHGELFYYIIENGKLHPETAKEVYAQIVSALDYCHGNLITHRDIKPENIMIYKKEIVGENDKREKLSIKLIDFGFATHIKTNSLHNTFCGSPDYAAPELLSGEKYNPMEIDVFSSGVVCYILYMGYSPWRCIDDHNVHQVMDAIKQCEYFDNEIDDKDFKDFISQIFVKANQRITIEGIKNHCWIRNYILPSYLPKREPIKQILKDLVKQIIFLGFEKQKIIESIYDGKNTQETAIYYLLLEEYNKNNVNKKKQPKFVKIKNHRESSSSENNLLTRCQRIAMISKRYSKSFDEIFTDKKDK